MTKVHDLSIHVGTREQYFIGNGLSISYDSRYRGFNVGALRGGGCC